MSNTSNWGGELSRTYNAHFTDDAIHLLKTASERVAQLSQGLNVKFTVRTLDVFHLLTEPEAPLGNLELLASKKNYKILSKHEEPDAVRFDRKGFNPSVELHACIEHAVDRAHTVGPVGKEQPGTGEVSSWHLAYTLLAADVPIISKYLENCGSSLDLASYQFLNDFPKVNPQLYKQDNWAEGLKTPHTPPERSSKHIDTFPKVQDQLWENFLGRFSFEYNFQEVLARIKKHQFDFIKSLKQRNRHAAIEEIPSQITKETILYALLLSSIEQQDLTKSLVRPINLLWAKRVIERTNTRSDDLKLLLIHSMQPSGASLNTKKTDLRLISIELLNFFESVKRLAKKLSNQPEISERHFIATWLRGENGKVQPRGIDGDAAQVFYTSLLEHVREDHETKLDDAETWGTIFNDIEAYLDQNKYIGVTDSFKFEDKSSAWTNGNDPEYRRNSNPEELGGTTKDYAEAIADAFERSNDSDFCFALFGPWGSGKTTLMGLVAEKLKGSFTTVTFNAWKYPTRPEIWVSLYEKICEEAGLDPGDGKKSWFKRLKLSISEWIDIVMRSKRDSEEPTGNFAEQSCWWNRLKLSLQTNLKRDKGLPLTFAGILLLFSAIPKGEILNATFVVNTLPAAITMVILGLYFLRLWKGYGQALKTYFLLPSHKKHLGLQSVIGDDLKDLLITWTDQEQPSKLEELRRYWGYLLGYFSIIGSLVIIQCRFYDLFSIWLIIAFALVLISSVGLLCLLRPIHHAKKVLLVVDDLDRCQPDEMLAVVESLRVLLDDKKVSERLKIAMLIDSRILGHAIARKYKHLADLENSTFKTKSAIRAICPKQLIEEQIEKLFLLSFQIPPLSEDEVESIAKKLVAEDEDGQDDDLKEAQEDRKIESDSKNIEDAEGLKIKRNLGTHVVLTDEEKRQSVVKNKKAFRKKYATASNRVSNKEEDGEFDGDDREIYVLSRTEKDALKAAFKYLHKNKPNELTPRRMRMLQMRFYLARDLCNRLDCQIHPDKVLQLIEADDEQLKREENKLLQHIIRMVRSAPEIQDEDPEEPKKKEISRYDTAEPAEMKPRER